MITLKKLQWSNLFSYGADNCIDFSAEPITQLVGLNGHGKSSIPLILEEVLYNKNSKGIKKGDVVNRNLDTNKYNIYLEFSVFEDEYTITLNRTGATQKVKLTKNGNDISSHTATSTFSTIESLIGMDFKTFSQIEYQNSHSSLQFLTATDTARKNFLIELLSLDKYVKIFEAVKKLHKDALDKLIDVKARVESVESWIAKNSKLSTSVPLGIFEVPELDETIQPRITEISNTIRSIDSINQRITKNNEYKRILASLDKTKLSCKDTPVDADVPQQEYNRLTIEKKHASAKLSKYSGVHEGECPTCLQQIDMSVITKLKNEANSELSEVTAQLNKLSQQLAEAKEVNRRVAEHRQLVEQFEKYSNLVDESLPTMLEDKVALSKQLTDLTGQLNQMRSDIDAVKASNQKALIHNAKLETISEQLDTFIKDKEALTVTMGEVEKSLGLLEVLKKAFSTNGLLAYKIENSVKDLEQLTNDYLAELSDGRFQLEFSLQNDKLNIVIIDNGASIDIAALSAGELARVTTSTLLAIRKLMSSLSKCRINLLFLDEVIDVLDAHGKERLIEVLLKEDYLNTFIISHGYSHPLINKISVVKENGISRLDYGS